MLQIFFFALFCYQWLPGLKWNKDEAENAQHKMSLQNWIKQAKKLQGKQRE